MPNLVTAKQSYTPSSSNVSERQSVAVTPADGSDLPNGPCAALSVTVGGNVNVQLVGGGTAVLTSLVAGVIYNIQVSRILATSTTATGIVAHYHAGNL